MLLALLHGELLRLGGWKIVLPGKYDLVNYDFTKRSLASHLLSGKFTVCCLKVNVLNRKI